MILVDTSVWVDYFNGNITAETNFLDAILGVQPVLLGDMILSEILQGFREDADFEAAHEALSTFEIVPILNLDLAVRSAMNYRVLRKRGIKVRKTIDCFIATYCIETGSALLTMDRDFEPFETHLGLAVIHAPAR